MRVRRRRTLEVHQQINQDSGDTEYYTPQFIIERARNVMRGIDLDPASSPAANMRVQAREIYTQADDGLSQKWHGSVWMNHPFSRQGNKLWIEKLITEYEGDETSTGNILQACCITFAATSEAWFQPLMRYPQCFLTPRTNYYKPDGTRKVGVTKGSVVTYLGHATVLFNEQFKDLGAIKVRMGY